MSLQAASDLQMQKAQLVLGLQLCESGSEGLAKLCPVFGPKYTDISNVCSFKLLLLFLVTCYAAKEARKIEKGKTITYIAII